MRRELITPPIMKHLTPREEEIMKHFWANGPMTVQTLRSLYPEPLPHFNTLSSLVRLLEEKGWLGHTPQGKSYVYHPLLSETDAGRRSVRSIVSEYFGNSCRRLVSNLVKSEDISIEELRSLLDEIENSSSDQ